MRAFGGRSDRTWLTLLLLFTLTSLVEPIGMSQIIALMPQYLVRLGIASGDVPHWVGLFTPLIFLSGLPLVPLWGVWADKYSRKAVIVRSSLVETVVLAGVAASGVPWQLAASLLLIGLSLGNTGVMLSALRDATPPQRVGLAIATVGAAGPVGFAIGPVLAAFLVDGLGVSLAGVFAVSGALMLLVTITLVLAMPDVRPAIVPTGRVIALAYGALRDVVADRSTRSLFALFGIVLLAGQMASVYLPLLVDHVNGGGIGLVSAIGLVVGGAALVGALASPLAGAVGDRIGFRAMLALALGGAGLALLVMPTAGSVVVLALIATLYALCNTSARAMLFALLAVEIPADRRTTTLNLVFLPLYLAGIAGPALGALVVSFGLSAVYVTAAMLVLGCAVQVGRTARRPGAAIV